MAVAINSCAGFSIGRAVPLCRLSRRSPGPRSGFNIRMSTITGVESKEARDMLLPSPSRSASKEGLEYKINDEIDCEKVRLLLPILTDPDADAADDVLGPVINDLKLSDGIVNTADALQIASRLNLDLVLINERGIPPVCKIINVGKYKYQQEKRKKLQEKKQVHQVIKEFKLSCNINQHDIDIRIKAAKEHLEAGDKVKFTVEFKGRELKHLEIGAELLNRLVRVFEGSVVIEEPPKQAGRSMYVVIRPKKKI